MDKYLKSFVIGSSYPVFLFPCYNVSKMGSSERNYTYQTYTFIAPLYIGIMNVLSLYLASQLSLSLIQRYYLISIISATIVCLFSTYRKAYNYSQKQWIFYYIRIFALHTFLYTVIIYSIEKILK